MRSNDSSIIEIIDDLLSSVYELHFSCEVAVPVDRAGPELFGNAPLTCPGSIEVEPCVNILECPGGKDPSLVDARLVSIICSCVRHLARSSDADQT